MRFGALAVDADAQDVKHTCTCGYHILSYGHVCNKLDELKDIQPWGRAVKFENIKVINISTGAHTRFNGIPSELFCYSSLDHRRAKRSQKCNKNPIDKMQPFLSKR